MFTINNKVNEISFRHNNTEYYAIRIRPNGTIWNLTNCNNHNSSNYYTSTIEYMINNNDIKDLKAI